MSKSVEPTGRAAMPPGRTDLLALAAQIVSAHCASHTVAAADLPGLIHRVRAALAAAEPADAPAAIMILTPAVPIKRSVFPDYIVCLEDGKKMKMLRRHLNTAYGMTPQQYRQRWDLPPDYPMVAPNYAKRRSALAKQTGLGRKVSSR